MRQKVKIPCATSLPILTDRQRNLLETYELYDMLSKATSIEPARHERFVRERDRAWRMIKMDRELQNRIAS